MDRPRRRAQRRRHEVIGTNLTSQRSRLAAALGAGSVAIVGGAWAIAEWGQDGAIVVASIATASATVVLAWVTSTLVRVTREMATQPALVPSLWFFASNVFLDLHNAGNGAAVDLDLTIEWRLGNSTAELTTTRSQWRASVLPPGRRVRFNPPQLKKSGWLQGDALGILDSVTVSGTMRNSRGQTIPVTAAINEPAELWDFEVESRRQFPENYETDEIIAKQMKVLAEQATQITELLAGRTTPPAHPAD